MPNIKNLNKKVTLLQQNCNNYSLSVIPPSVTKKKVFEQQITVFVNLQPSLINEGEAMSLP